MVITVKVKRIAAFLLAAFTIAAYPAISAGAFVPYESYTYSTATGETEYVYSPTPYIPTYYLDAKRIGTPLGALSDMAFYQDELYLLDKGLGQIVVLDASYRLKRVISGFLNNGAPDRFSEPNGFFIAKNGDITVCDTGNKRLVALDNSGSLLRVYDAPQSPLLTEGYDFAPNKVAVDDAGTLYVINNNETAGLMKLGADGSFLTYIGSNKAIVDPILRLWKKIMSDEQSQQLISFVPVEYHNICMDQDGFIYAVSAVTSESTPVKRLNLSGTDILIRLGYVDVEGDALYETEEDSSILVDICAADNGNYYALDANRCRIFAYNQEGYLLYAFGAKGSQIGNLTNPSAIECRGDSLLVMDEISASVTVFEKTEYAKMVTAAETNYYKGNYDESLALWQEVAKINPFFELGYLQMGKIYLQKKQNKLAMEYFERGNYRGDSVAGMTGYNRAFTQFRKEFMAQYMGWCIAAAIGLIVLWAAVRWLRARKKQRRRNTQ